MADQTVNFPNRIQYGAEFYQFQGTERVDGRLYGVYHKEGCNPAKDWGYKVSCTKSEALGYAC